MKIVGFIGYTWIEKWHRYSAFSYVVPARCPVSGRVFSPSRSCFLDEDSIYLPTSISEERFWELYQKNRNRM